jgi:hypothetical protein
MTLVREVALSGSVTVNRLGNRPWPGGGSCARRVPGFGEALPVAPTTPSQTSGPVIASLPVVIRFPVEQHDRARQQIVLLMLQLDVRTCARAGGPRVDQAAVSPPPGRRSVSGAPVR